MNSPRYETVPVTCPNCRNRFVSPVLTVIDAGQSPEAKVLFLSGQINVAACPQCGHAGVLSTPLVYHDADKQLLFTYVPPELGLPELEQQRVVGELTNRVMTTLPAEQRKGYLLRPRSFLRLDGMIEAILEADGITPQMLEAQRSRSALLDRLLTASSEESRRIIAQENDDQIDYQFFQILTLNLEVAQANNRPEVAQQLLDLRQELLEWTTSGREVVVRQKAIEELGNEITRERLLDKLAEAALASEQAKVEAMVTFARPVIDYVFYQQLTARIEAAEGKGDLDQAAALRGLRERILDLTAEIDAEVKRAREEATAILREIMQSEDLDQAVRANVARIDDLFLEALAVELQISDKAGRTDDVAKLRKVSDAVMKLIQESQPPQIQFINQLLSKEYPDGTQALLEENREQVDTQLLEIMALVEEDLTQTGRHEVAEHLAQIREQAAAMVPTEEHNQASD